MADILLPELGEGITSVEISDVLVNTGDVIKVDDTLIVVETEKTSMEIPATEKGTVENVQVEKGSTISPGDVIISITGDRVQTKAVSATPPSIEETAEPQDGMKSDPPAHPITPEIGKPALASPSVRRFARELGCDIKLVTGTGPKGRIIQEDVQEFIKNRMTNSSMEFQNTSLTAPGQDLDFAKWGNVDIQPLNKIKRITGERLQRTCQAIPHVTQFDKADITKLEKLRVSLKKVNQDETIKVSIIPFIMKAVTRILKEMPIFNSSLDISNKNLVLKQYFHVGIAVDTENGLVVPVIRDVDQKNIKELARELSEMSQKARKKQLLPEDMAGGCFTISSLGGIGGTYFTPIINPPQVAILGISQIQTEPVYLEKKFRKRKVLPFSLSYDHRVIDGADSARFTNRLGNILSNLEELTRTS